MSADLAAAANRICTIAARAGQWRVADVQHRHDIGSTQVTLDRDGHSHTIGLGNELLRDHSKHGKLVSYVQRTLARLSEQQSPTRQDRTFVNPP